FKQYHHMLMEVRASPPVAPRLSYYNVFVRKFWDNSAPAASDLGLRGKAAPGEGSLGPAPRVVPSSLQIGSVTISPATVLAPMAGVTDTVVRRFIRNTCGCRAIMT